MKKWIVILGSLFVMCLLSSENGFAGAWVQPKGKLFSSVIYYYYKTSHYFDSDGDLRKRGGTFTKLELNPYFEYGLTVDDTIFLNIYYDWLEDDRITSSEETSGLSDLETGWRRVIWTDGLQIISSQLTVVVPLGYDIEDDPRLGYGRYAIEGALQYGTSFQFLSRYGFLDTFLGYRVYVGYPSDQMRAKLSLGYDLFENLQLAATGELHYGMDNGSEKSLGNNILLMSDYKLLKLSLSARFRLSSHVSVVGTGYTHAWGENTGAGGGFYGSLWFSY